MQDSVAHGERGQPRGGGHPPGPPPCLEFHEKTPQPQNRLTLSPSPQDTPTHRQHNLPETVLGQAPASAVAWDFSLSSCSL